jgi:hypothetical protein
MGYLTVQVAFDGPVATSAAGLAPLSGDGGTPLTDVILSFDAFGVMGACDDTADTSDGGEDTTSVGDSTAVEIGTLAPASDGDDGEWDDEDEDSCTYWTELDSTITISASKLDTTLTGILGTVLLPEGWYERIYLHLVGAWVVTADGDTVETHLPGHNESLKVNSPFHVEADETTPLAIVFDADRAVVESPPGSRNFHLKPVMHAHQGWYDREDHDGDSDD